MSNQSKPCACIPGEACDYHAATCIVCYPRCKGHPISSDPYRALVETGMVEELQ